MPLRNQSSGDTGTTVETLAPEKLDFSCRKPKIRVFQNLWWPFARDLPRAENVPKILAAAGPVHLPVRLYQFAIPATPGYERVSILSVEERVPIL
jgi:hypothetical protein